MEVRIGYIDLRLSLGVDQMVRLGEVLEIGIVFELFVISK